MVVMMTWFGGEKWWRSWNRECKKEGMLIIKERKEGRKSGTVRRKLLFF
jgi:hypothetical protein